MVSRCFLLAHSHTVLSRLLGRVHVPLVVLPGLQPPVHVDEVLLDQHGVVLHLRPAHRARVRDQPDAGVDGRRPGPDLVLLDAVDVVAVAEVEAEAGAADEGDVIVGVWAEGAGEFAAVGEEGREGGVEGVVRLKVREVGRKNLK